MEYKVCSKCGESRELLQFDRDYNSKDPNAKKSRCRPCGYEERKHRMNTDPRAFLLDKFSTMKKRCKRDPHYIGKLHLTKEEFIEWAVPELQVFVQRNNIDLSTGYLNKSISIDKIDDELGYRLGNLQFLFKGENSKKMTITSGRVKEIVMLTKDGELVETFESVAEGARYLGDIKKDNCIRNVLKGRRPSAYGYVWEYLEEYNKKRGI